jgi:hypothetical protein
MGQTAISCTDRRQASPEARPHRLTLIIGVITHKMLGTQGLIRCAHGWVVMGHRRNPCNRLCISLYHTQLDRTLRIEPQGFQIDYWPCPGCWRMATDQDGHAASLSDAPTESGPCGRLRRDGLKWSPHSVRRKRTGTEQ